MIVITIQTTSEPDIIVAGAMVPVSRIPSSFPFQFRINAKNAIQSSKASSLSPQETWNYVMTNDDLLVRAVVCSREAILFDDGNKNRDIYKVLDMCHTTVAEMDTSSPMSTLQLQQSQTPLSGQGIAKLIRYSGEENTSSSNRSNNVTIRAPVSLPLG